MSAFSGNQAEFGLLLGADGQAFFLARPAARRKAAAGWQVDQVWHDARDDIQFILDLAQNGYRGQQPLGLGVAGVMKDGPYVAFLDNPAGIHHRHAGGHVRHRS